MPYSGPLEDRILIRELIEAYADAVMIRDADAWGAVWAEDAYWSLPEVPGHEEFIGRKAIVKGWVDSMTQYASMTDYAEPMIYIATPGAIEVDGNTATARVYTSEIYKELASGEELRVRGQYDDALRKTDGQWLFTRRIYKILYASQG